MHKAVDPADGEVYLWMSFEPDEARYVWACFDQPDLKAPHALHGDRARRVDGGQQHRRPRGRRAGGGHPHAGPSPTRRRCRRTTRWSTPARSTRSAARLDGYDLGLFARRSLAAMLDRDADEIFTLTEQGLAFFGDVVRDAVPAAQVRPGLRARLRRRDGELRLRHLVRLRSCAGPRRPRPSASCSRWSCCTRWRTCGSATSSRCAGGTTSGSTRRSPSSPPLGGRDARPRTPTPGPATWPASKLAAYLADQGPTSHPIRQPIRDVARGRVDLRRDHLSQGRLGAAAAHDVRRRGAVHGRAWRPTSPGTPGATPRCRT